jgi:uncharacterized membrane protein (DUF373 family)
MMNEQNQSQERTNGPEPDSTSPQPASSSQQADTQQSHPQASIAARWLDKGDNIIYALVGLGFFLAALIALAYAGYHFYLQLAFPTSNHNGPQEQGSPLIGSDSHLWIQAIITLVSDLLLVLIIMEVLSTVLHYLREHITALKPFLFVGIISATRGVLVISARIIVTPLEGPEFTQAIIELSANTVVILVLGITLRVLGKEGIVDFG